MDILRAIEVLWPIFTAIVFVVFCGLVWGLRLEGKNKGLETRLVDLKDEHLKLRGDHDNLNNKTLAELSGIKETLAEVKTILMIKFGQKPRR